MKKVVYLLLVVAGLTSVMSCKKSTSNNNTIKNVDSLDDMVISPDFNYRSSNDVTFEIQLNAPDATPITGVPITINQVVADTLQAMFTIMTNQNGLAEGLFTVPSGIESVVVSANYIGIPNNLIVPIDENNEVVLDLSGITAQKMGNYQSFVSGKLNNIVGSKTRNNLNYKFLSPHNNQGVPTIKATKETITAQMLNFVNQSLPERSPVMTHHPAYLQSNVKTDIDIVAASDVWVTFVHEGAGYMNTLCYYKYPTNNPPTNANQIDTAFVVFANASYFNSGGGLQSGDRVKIGTFPAGTSIGFICVSNGWTGNNVGNGTFRLFSDKNLNPQVNPSLKQHNILLYDNINQRYYLAFEDIARDNNSCDHDFNDIVFSVTSNPVTAISNFNVPLADNGIDTDGDGVSDIFDAFPNDNQLAYKNYLPAKDKFGTMAFEDLWPGKGDYDFNDLVLGYQFEQWTNAQNRVKEMKCRFAIRAIGASYKHGFGFQMNVPPSAVSNVTGQEILDGTVTLSGNKTEAGQTLATIIAFDNDYKVVNRPQGNSMNTDPLKPFQVPDTVNLNITFTTPRTQAELGAAPFNPFIFINGDRGKEVHFAGYQPTSLANAALFGTSHDNTNLNAGRYYKTKNNLPFALHVADAYDYTKEKVAINHGHLRFVAWAQSSGVSFPDWYKSVTGNRDNTKIYAP